MVRLDGELLDLYKWCSMMPDVWCYTTRTVELFGKEVTTLMLYDRWIDWSNEPHDCESDEIVISSNVIDEAVINDLRHSMKEV